MRKFTKVCVLLFLASLCYGQSNFTRGEEFFMQNNPAQAVVFLERSFADDPSNVTTCLYLGVVYEQLGRTEEAITIYRRILPLAGNMAANVTNNLGNVYFRRGNIDEAERYYTEAISFNSGFSNAYLGRANTRIKAGNLQSAIMDYEQYLRLDPRSSQRVNIERLIALVRSEAATAEMRKLLAEEEERRLAQERQRLLDSVSASLQSVVDSTMSMSSGTENVEQYEGEFVLE
ncbi:MAG: tetratricopeptide repeat protein [Treponema sp.]|nr:tetratricopeptide repeat protein [Treponema sp.]